MREHYGHYVSPDTNITNYSTGHYVQQTTVNESFVLVEDPQIGDFVVDRRRDNGLYYDYLTTAAAFRSGGVSQLCKDQSSGTIPNTYSMTRRWHTNGLFYIVDWAADKLQATPEQRLAWHLATDVDDQAHLLFSHAMELGIQGWGGGENFHERQWPTVAAIGGLTDVLDKHGVTYDDTIRIPGIDIPPLFEGERNDVNLDRLQYAVTELLLWFDHDGASPEIRSWVREMCSLDNFAITEDKKLAFKDKEIALLFSKGYLLLSTEHWNDPINRVQLHLLIQASQHAILQRRISWMQQVDKGVPRRPEHYLYGIDQDVVDSMGTGPGQADDFIYAIKNSLYPIAMQERQRFIDYKQAEYASFLLDERARDYPSELLTPTRVDFGPPSSQVGVELAEADEGTVPQPKLPLLRHDDAGVSYTLQPLKNRYVDPLVMVKGMPRTLSEIDVNYARLKEEQQQLQKMGVVVRLAFASGFEQAFKHGVNTNDKEFQDMRRVTSDMTSDQQRTIIELAAERAKALNVATGSLVLKAV